MEKFEVPALYLANKSVMALYGGGQMTGTYATKRSGTVWKPSVGTVGTSRYGTGTVRNQAVGTVRNLII